VTILRTATQHQRGYERALGIVHTRRVGMYVRFFVAEDDEAAAAVLPTGPGRAFTTVSGAFFDPDDAMMIWAQLAEAGAGRWDTGGDQPATVACGGNDGSAVYVMPGVLMAALTRLEPDRLCVIAEVWQAEVADGQSLDQGDRP
jgi:hypothetical protein